MSFQPKVHTIVWDDGTTEHLTLKEAAKKYQIKYELLNSRVNAHKLPLKEALFKPKAATSNAHATAEWHGLSNKPRTENLSLTPDLTSYERLYLYPEEE